MIEWAGGLGRFSIKASPRGFLGNGQAGSLERFWFMVVPEMTTFNWCFTFSLKIAITRRRDDFFTIGKSYPS